MLESETSVDDLALDDHDHLAPEADDPTPADAEQRACDHSSSMVYLALGAAYEIQCPLSRLLGRLKVARARLDAWGETAEGAEVTEALRALDDATEDARRIGKLVDGLRQLGGASPSATETFDVHEALELALELLASPLGERATVERRYADLPPVAGPFGRLAQAFVDILTNSIEAIPSRSPAANHVRVETHLAAPGYVVIRITDTGAGIEPADLPHVFDPFFTGKPRPTSTGLGLSAARSAVTAFDGRVTIESQLGLGAVVTIVLPAAAAWTDEPPTVRSELRPTDTILVVDEDPLVCERLSRLLDSRRATLDYAKPDEALEQILLGKRPDLVVVARETENDGDGFRARLEQLVPSGSLLVVTLTLPPDAIGRNPLESHERLPSVA